mgnify:CR=1 FL=1
MQVARQRQPLVPVLGHVQRGGSPTPFDRVLATLYGIELVVDVVRGHKGHFGRWCLKSEWDACEAGLVEVKRRREEAQRAEEERQARRSNLAEATKTIFELKEQRDAAIDRERKQAITIGDLLTMRSGLERTSGQGYGDWVGSGNWVPLPPPLAMPSARPLQRDSWLVEPGCVFTHSTFFEPLLAKYSPPPLPATYSSLPT